MCLKLFSIAKLQEMGHFVIHRHRIKYSITFIYVYIFSAIPVFNINSVVPCQLSSTMFANVQGINGLNVQSTYVYKLHVTLLL